MSVDHDGEALLVGFRIPAKWAMPALYYLLVVGILGLVAVDGLGVGDGLMGEGISR